jgi:Family of unknown function (DUF5985)
MNELLSGAASMGSLVAALFFARFWHRTRDRLFLMFAAAFAVDALMRVFLAVAEVPNEQEPFIYLGRLASFLLIIVAIIDKNRAGTGP